MKIIYGQLPKGAECRPFEAHHDQRGTFREIYCDHWNTALKDISQLSVVHSKQGVLRGMYFHRQHDEYISLLKGSAIIGLSDLRDNSSSFGTSCLIEVGQDSPCCVSFPRGILHGWLFTNDSVHLQAVSESYREYADHDNLGCRWDDPELDLPWPVKPTMVSDRTDSLGSLQELMATIRNLEAAKQILHAE